MGYKFSDIVRKNMSVSKRGNKSRIGTTHTEETRIKMSEAHIGKILSEETKAKLSAAKTGEKNPRYGKARPAGAGSPRQNIEVLDTETNERTVFECIRDAARALGISPSGISKYFSRNQVKLYKGRYIFKKL
jgi:group I intron endonuclease